MGERRTDQKRLVAVLLIDDRVMEPKPGMFVRVVPCQHVPRYLHVNAVPVRENFALNGDSLHRDGVGVPFCPVDREPKDRRFLPFRPSPQREKSETVAIPRRPVNISHIPRIQTDLDPFAFFRVRQAAPGALFFAGNPDRKEQRLFIPTGPKINRQPPRRITTIPVIKKRKPKRFVQRLTNVPAMRQRDIIVRETKSKNKTFRKFQEGQMKNEK